MMPTETPCKLAHTKLENTLRRIHSKCANYFFTCRPGRWSIQFPETGNLIDQQAGFPVYNDATETPSFEMSS